MVNNISADEAIIRHTKGGIPAGKLVLGIPFYGYKKAEQGEQGEPTVAYRHISQTASLANCTEKWDDIAKMPYLVNAENEVVFVYDNARSIGYKCEYLLQQGLLGAMYWEYNQDDSERTLSKAVWNGVMKD